MGVRSGNRERDRVTMKAYDKDARGEFAQSFDCARRAEARHVETKRDHFARTVGGIAQHVHRVTTRASIVTFALQRGNKSRRHRFVVIANNYSCHIKKYRRECGVPRLDSVQGSQTVEIALPVRRFAESLPERAMASTVPQFVKSGGGVAKFEFY